MAVTGTTTATGMKGCRPPRDQRQRRRAWWRGRAGRVGAEGETELLATDVDTRPPASPPAWRRRRRWRRSVPALLTGRPAALAEATAGRPAGLPRAVAAGRTHPSATAICGHKRRAGRGVECRRFIVSGGRGGGICRGLHASDGRGCPPPPAPSIHSKPCGARPSPPTPRPPPPLPLQANPPAGPGPRCRDRDASGRRVWKQRRWIGMRGGGGGGGGRLGGRAAGGRVRDPCCTHVLGSGGRLRGAARGLRPPARRRWRPYSPIAARSDGNEYCG